MKLAGILALGVALPSAIFGAAILSVSLAQKGYFPFWVAAVIIVAIIANTFFVMIRYARKRNSKSD